MKKYLTQLLSCVAILTVVIAFPAAANKYVPGQCGSGCLANCYSQGIDEETCLADTAKEYNQANPSNELYIAVTIFGVAVCITFVLIKLKKSRKK